ncbi:MAG: Holliday junction branch migration protein RuvA [Verrucomicrobia bacterium]|nr:Holliday junction branch migration protein RuvA [Verrucomicrobiota bacterium]MDA1087467.1 Holliday junction branch migration protein RuvA [Verrucomicrobiota bacterium]
MICFLEGTIVDKQPTRVVLNVAGVGYEMLIPLSSYDRLPSTGETCHIETFDYVREDQHALYGFMSAAEKEMFELLLGITGIGPKLALSALSGMSVREIRAAVVDGDQKRLSAISGVGRKMAERMIVELRDKLSAGDALAAVFGEDDDMSDHRLRDAMLALISLGYKQKESRKMVRDVLDSADQDTSVEDVIRQALARR